MFALQGGIAYENIAIVHVKAALVRLDSNASSKPHNRPPCVLFFAPSNTLSGTLANVAEQTIYKEGRMYANKI